jgi:hypothetical protein
VDISAHPWTFHPDGLCKTSYEEVQPLSSNLPLLRTLDWRRSGWEGMGSQQAAGASDFACSVACKWERAWNLFALDIVIIARNGELAALEGG